MKKRKLISLLKRQGFTETFTWNLIPKTFRRIEGNFLIVNIDGTTSFLFGRSGADYKIRTYYVDIDTNNNALLTLLCVLFGKYEPSIDGESLHLEINDTVRKHFLAIV